MERRVHLFESKKQERAIAVGYLHEIAKGGECKYFYSSKAKPNSFAVDLYLNDVQASSGHFILSRNKDDLVSRPEGEVFGSFGVSEKEMENTVFEKTYLVAKEFAKVVSEGLERKIKDTTRFKDENFVEF